MKRNILYGILVILIAVVGYGIIRGRGGIIVNDMKHKDTSTVVDANNQFALDLYAQLQKEENMVFSPFSISNALAMVYEGAEGLTSEELHSVLYLPEDDQVRRSEYSAILDKLRKNDAGYELRIASALWAQEDYRFLPEYLRIVNTYYDGHIESMDFKRNPDKSRSMINDWVERQTNGRIKDLVHSDSIHSMTKMILTNALYLKAEWMEEFSRKNTRDESFNVTQSHSVTVPMMRRTGGSAEFKYTENDIMQMLEMPYINEDLSMFILLPKDQKMARLEESLSSKALRAWKTDLEYQRVDVFIPRFRLETHYSMRDELSIMGMPTPFRYRDADFSGMDGTRELYIEEVIHKVFIEVDEEGTEATAATAVLAPAGGMPAKERIVPVFRADHPFVFMVQEHTSGAILFIGRLVNPTS